MTISEEQLSDVAHEHRWLLSDELDFLRGLGTWTERKRHLTIAERIEAYQAYLAQMSNRTRWGHIDPDELRAAVLALIHEVEQERP